MKALIALLLVALAPAAPMPPAGTPVAPAPVPPGTTAPAPPGPAPDTWLPRTAVQLMVLDKVSARATVLAGKVGQELHYGSLTVVAEACVVRPPDVPADAAAFLDITDQQTGVAPFHAWMLLAEPSQSIYQHPVYDITLAGCAG